MDVANGTVCPVCNGALIPGLDACYCKSCRVYYHTPIGLKALQERQQKKSAGSKTKQQLKLSSDSSNLTLFELFPSSGYSHHEIENSN